MAGQAIRRAGITATVLVGAMMAAGPAAAAAAAPAAHAATTARAGHVRRGPHPGAAARWPGWTARPSGGSSPGAGPRRRGPGR